MTVESQVSPGGVDPSGAPGERAEREQAAMDLWLPACAESPEPGVLFLDGSEPSGAPLVSPTLAALYARQGDVEHARAAQRALDTPAGTDAAAWLEGLRDAHGAWVIDGRAASREPRAAERRGEAADAGWDEVIQAARALAAQLGSGAATLSIRRAGGRVAIQLLAGRAVGIEGGAAALIGQLRQRVREVARTLQ